MSCAHRGFKMSDSNSLISGYWKFSAEVQPQVIAFLEQYSVSKENHSKPEDYNVWHSLLGHELLGLQPLKDGLGEQSEWSSEESVCDESPKRTSLVEEEKSEVIQEPAQIVEVDLTANFIDDSLYVPTSPIEEKYILQIKDPTNETELTELLSETDPQRTAEIMGALSDDGVCNCIEILCAMKPVNQVKFHRIIAKQLLVRLQGTSVKLTRQVSSGLSRFVTSFPEVSCGQLLPPFIVHIDQYSHHSDTLRDVVKSVNPPYTQMLLKSVIRDLRTLSEFHLPILVALVAPTEDQAVIQNITELLSDSADTFQNNIKYGQLLVTVIQHYATNPLISTKLADIVARHHSMMSKKALRLLDM